MWTSLTARVYAAVALGAANWTSRWFKKKGAYSAADLAVFARDALSGGYRWTGSAEDMPEEGIPESEPGGRLPAGGESAPGDAAVTRYRTPVTQTE